MQSHWLTILNNIKKNFPFHLVKQLDFDPDPESDQEIPVK